MSLTISSLSKQYVRVPVSATNAGSSVDLSAGTVTMAFTDLDTEPVVSDWNASSWETDTTRTPNRYYARCLIGPGAVTLTDGTYRVWVKVTGIGTEIPVLKIADVLVVT